MTRPDPCRILFIFFSRVGPFIVLLLLILLMFPCAFLVSGTPGSTEYPNPLPTKTGADDIKAVWIYFADKGDGIPQKLDLARGSLRLRALNLRLRHSPQGDLVDKLDIPVESGYVEALRPHVRSIRHESRWLNAVSADASEQALKTISEFSFVIRIEPVRIFHFREPDLTRNSGLTEVESPAAAHTFDYGQSLNQVEQINVPALHDLGYSGKDVLICMLDTGFDALSHEALLYLDVRDTWDFVNNDPDVFDEAGQMGSERHGTQTLGSLAGFSPGKLIGPAYGASFLLAKTENTVWERHIEEDHWVAGLEWAELHGADIVSSSLGYRDRFTHGEPDYSSEDMDGQTTVVTRAANVAAQKGLLIVNSAGNDGDAAFPGNTLIAPADSTLVLAVGAVNSRGQRVSFSSMGPTADGRIKPDVMAQGQAVLTVSTDTPAGYVLVDGTSFSCPLVAGTAALLLEINPTWTNTDIINALKSTASNAAFPDNRTGWGIVNAVKASVFIKKNIFPPAEFKADRTNNNFGFFTQFVDVLTWKPNPANGERITDYRIYGIRRDSSENSYRLIAELDGRTFHHQRRGLLREETYLYKITAVDSSGEESDPLFADTTNS